MKLLSTLAIATALAGGSASATELDYGAKQCLAGKTSFCACIKTEIAPNVFAFRAEDGSKKCTPGAMLTAAAAAAINNGGPVDRENPGDDEISECNVPSCVNGAPGDSLNNRKNPFGNNGGGNGADGTPPSGVDQGR